MRHLEPGKESELESSKESDTARMADVLERGFPFTAAAEREIAREVREELRRFGADYDTEL